MTKVGILPIIFSRKKQILVFFNFLSFGDLDGDGDVDYSDIAIVVNCLGKDLDSHPECRKADLISKAEPLIDEKDLHTIELMKDQYEKGLDKGAGIKPALRRLPSIEEYHYRTRDNMNISRY